jgi:hypothetical protein
MGWRSNSEQEEHEAKMKVQAKRLFTLTFVVAVTALSLRASPASANNCLKDIYGKNVQCTANDVSVAFADNPRTLGGAPF